METQYYALIGHCKMAPGLKLGVSVYRYDPATAAMTYVGNYAQKLKVGAQCYHPGHNRLYAVNEFWNLEGQTGGGGHVATLKLDKTSGQLEQTSIRRTYATNPSYVAVDKTGRYLLVSHHCTDRFATRMVKTENGYETQVFYDLATLLLFRLEENGDIGPIVDVFQVEGHDRKGEHTFPHLHCVVPDPGKNYYIVCDKGLDKIYSFRIDYEKEKLVKCWEVDGKPGSEPRYCNFHPQKPIFYSNCESSVDVNAYALDLETGKFHRIATCESLPETAGVSPSDVVVHPSGNFLYTSLRGTNQISALEVMEESCIVLRQTISSGGGNPRGLCVSPDGRFLLAANMDDGCISIFTIGEDGLLTVAGKTVTGGFPGNVQIIAVEAGAP